MLNDFLEYQQSFDPDPDNIFYFWQKKRRNKKYNTELDSINILKREDFYDRD